MTAVNEIKISEIIHRSSIPDADYEINPYVGLTITTLDENIRSTLEDEDAPVSVE